MKTLDFKQWAVVAHKDGTGFGRQAREIGKVLSFGRHVVIPSELLKDHPLNPHNIVVLPKDAPEGFMLLEAICAGLAVHPKS
jgi:hypothetical protein